MPRKISNETKQLIEELYAEGLPVVEIAKRVNVSYPTAYGYTKVKERGFASYLKYQEHLAKERGFASYSKYQEHWAKERGFASHSEYQKHSAKERGFASLGEYQDHLAKQRQQQPINQTLSDLIKTRLAELDRTQRWLAKQLGITEGAISRYISGRTTPRRSLQERLFETLELSYQTLDDLLD